MSRCTCCDALWEWHATWHSGHMAIGTLIRDLRLSREWSQRDLAEELGRSSGRPDGGPDRTTVARWETGAVIPGPTWRTVLSRVLDVPVPTLAAAANLSRMERRSFLTLSALTAAHGKAASAMMCSVVGGDAGPLAMVQTTHGTDLVIAAMADKTAVRYLRRWMTDGADPVLRVNAAGILAKTPGQSAAVDVARVLIHDHDVRALYSTAVVARACAVDWTLAARLVADPLSMPDRAAYVARRLVDEVTNQRDAGARWCAADMLRGLSPLLGR